MRKGADVITAAAVAAVAAEMPDHPQIDTATAAFALLADPTRLRLMWLLRDDEHDVGTLARLAGAAPAATSQHLAKLRLARLVVVRRDGRRQLYRARGGHVRRLVTEALHYADHAVSGHDDHD